MADYAIHDTTLTGISNVIRKKDGTSALIDPADYADRINLMGMLEEKTVSGAIATFADGADDVPTKSLVVTIPPTISGVSSVTETQTGRNLLLPYNADSAEITVNGIKRSYSLDNQEFTFEGTNTKTDTSWLIFSINASDFELNGLKTGVTYRFSHNFTADMYAQFTYNKSGGGIGAMGYLRGNAGQNASVSFTLPSDFSSLRQFQIGVSNTARAINITAHFQIEFGSTAHAYEPYHTPTVYTAQLGRTIYGGEVDIVKGVGSEQGYKVVVDGTNLYFAKEGNYYNSYPRTLPTLGNPWKLAQSDEISFGYNSNYGGFIFLTVARAEEFGLYSAEEVNAYFAQNPTTIILNLATPTDFTFDGQEIPTRLGVNNFWSDSGDTEVTYRSQGTAYIYPNAEEASF